MTTIYERPFTNEVIKFARDHNWTVFHIHDQDSYENYRKIATGGGFPDLIMYRTDGQGRASMVVAELKTDAENSMVRPNQDEWLNAYKQFIPSTFVWRPSDWEEIERVLGDGPTSESDERTPPHPKSTMESHPPAGTSDKTLPPYWGTIISNLRAEIREQEFPRGQLAELRRMNINATYCPAFYRLSARRNLARIGGDDAEAKWATIIQGIALMTEHDRGPATRIGRALFSGGDRTRTTAFYNERRLNQLLAARGELLRTLLRRTFRMLVATEQAIYWFQVAELVLNDEYNEEEAERVRREIASDYYAAGAIATRESSTNQEE